METRCLTDSRLITEMALVAFAIKAISFFVSALE